MAYDLDILGDASGESDLLVSNKACDGIRKLAQRVLVLLFTDVDGEYSAGRGTALPEEVSGANNRDDEVVQGRFAIAASHVKETLTSSTPFDAPSDEKLQELKILHLERESEDQLMVEIQVISESGDDVVVRTPVDAIGE